MEETKKMIKQYQEHIKDKEITEHISNNSISECPVKRINRFKDMF